MLVAADEVEIRIILEAGNDIKTSLRALLRVSSATELQQHLEVVFVALQPTLVTTKHVEVVFFFVLGLFTANETLFVVG